MVGCTQRLWVWGTNFELAVYESKLPTTWLKITTTPNSGETHKMNTLHQPGFKVLCLAVLYAMLCKPSSEGWDSKVEQNCSCCARFDESRQRRKLVAPFLCKDSSSVLTCFVFLRSWYWQDLVPLQWGEVLWVCCLCSLQLFTTHWAQRKRSWGQAAPWGGGALEFWLPD